MISITILNQLNQYYISSVVLNREQFSWHRDIRNWND